MWHKFKISLEVLGDFEQIRQSKIVNKVCPTTQRQDR